MNPTPPNKQTIKNDFLAKFEWRDNLSGLPTEDSISDVILKRTTLDGERQIVWLHIDTLSTKYFVILLTDAFSEIQSEVYEQKEAKDKIVEIIHHSIEFPSNNTEERLWDVINPKESLFVEEIQKMISIYEKSILNL